MSVALSDLGDEVEEHVEAGLPRIFPHNVGGRQVEERGAQLGADGVEQHGLPAALRSHQQDGLDAGRVLPELRGPEGEDAVLGDQSSHVRRAWSRLRATGLEVGAAVGNIAQVLLQHHLGVGLDHVVHHQLLEQRLCRPVWGEVLVLLFLSLLASFLSLLPFLANFPLFTLVPLNSL